MSEDEELFDILVNEARRIMRCEPGILRRSEKHLVPKPIMDYAHDLNAIFEANCLPEFGNAW